MRLLRAKFKEREQLKEDTKKFKDDTFNMNISNMPDRIEIILSADSQEAIGVVDLDLYLVDGKEQTYTIKSQENLPKFIKFESDRENILDKVVFDMQMIKEDIALAKEMFTGDYFKVGVEVISILEGLLESNFHNFGIFNNLKIEVHTYSEDEHVVVSSIDINEYYPLKKERDFIEVGLRSDGTYVINFI